MLRLQFFKKFSQNGRKMIEVAKLVKFKFEKISFYTAVHVVAMKFHLSLTVYKENIFFRIGILCYRLVVIMIRKLTMPRVWRISIS